MIEFSEFNEEHENGYAFPLEKRSEIDCELTDSESTAVIFKKGKGYVFVLFKNPIENSATSYLKAIESASKSLDILSIKGLFNSNIKSPLPHYLRWSIEKDGISVELTQQSISNITLRQNSYPTFRIDNCNDCFRFYRLAQISPDIYDSYRNLWLCFEWLLSEKHPIREKEHEKDWVKRAFAEFTELAHDAELMQLLKTVNSNALIDTLYKETRLQLFHAKSNENYLIPNKHNDKLKVGNSLNMLTIVVDSMISYYCDNPPHKSWINPTIFVDPYKDMFKDLKTYISNIKVNGILDEQVFKKHSDNLDFASCKHSAKKEGDHVSHRLMAKIDTSNSSQSAVSRFSHVSKTGKELLAFTMDDELSLKDVKSIDFISTLEMSFIERARTYNYRF
ncbi:MAG: hypothetical protein JW963_12075 [Anaerolineales bacterium]|nr:hypothetical protein [Anaerolineales bacterium]